MTTYHAESRGFMNFYALADNLTTVAQPILWLTTMSFLHTLAGKRKSTLTKVANNLKRGPARYVIAFQKKDGVTKEYELVASTKQLKREKLTHTRLDEK